MMTMSQKALEQVTMDSAVGRSSALTATMVGLPKTMVTKIIVAGLPLMAQVADENPLAFKAMYAQSEKKLPEPMRLFQTKLASNPRAHQAMLDNFTTMFGAQTAAINREAASQAGASEEQAYQVLAMTMPAVVKALGKGNTDKSARGFGRQLRNGTA